MTNLQLATRWQQYFLFAALWTHSPFCYSRVGDLVKVGENQRVNNTTGDGLIRRLR